MGEKECILLSLCFKQKSESNLRKKYIHLPVVQYAEITVKMNIHMGTTPHAHRTIYVYFFNDNKYTVSQEYLAPIFEFTAQYRYQNVNLCLNSSIKDIQQTKTF